MSRDGNPSHSALAVQSGGVRLRFWIGKRGHWSRHFAASLMETPRKEVLEAAVLDVAAQGCNQASVPSTRQTPWQRYRYQRAWSTNPASSCEPITPGRLASHVRRGPARGLSLCWHSTPPRFERGFGSRRCGAIPPGLTANDLVRHFAFASTLAIRRTAPRSPLVAAQLRETFSIRRVSEADLFSLQYSASRTDNASRAVVLAEKEGDLSGYFYHSDMLR